MMSRSLWIAIGIVVFFVAVLALNNMNNPKSTQKSVEVWNQSMTKGDPNAPNKFIEYTDMTCPYCARFNNAVAESDFDREYVDSKKVHVEIRVTAMLQGKSVNSTRAGESAYCAADQGKFFAYHNKIVRKFTDDYFNKGIGTEKDGPKIPLLEDSYYIAVAKQAGVDTKKFTACLENSDMKDEISLATQKANDELPYGVGVPYFIINDYTGSGFSGTYKKVQQMMRAGGVN